MLFIFSVGGSNSEKHVSTNFVVVMDFAKSVGAVVLGVVWVVTVDIQQKLGDSCVIIATVNPDNVSPPYRGFSSRHLAFVGISSLVESLHDELGIYDMIRYAVFLDRDGVIVKAVLKAGIPHPPMSLSEVILVEGVQEGLLSLKRKGYTLIVVTNQPDVARGRQTRGAVEQIHDHLRKALPLDDIRVCYHDDSDSCPCRKPKPGLLVQAAYDFDIKLASSFMIGDRWRDVEAGQRAGCTCLFIDYGYDERKPVMPYVPVASTRHAISWIDNRKC
jgi:D-glycero-D-manno-heptose 1,7-bisphosphate phosphatase